MVLLIIDFINKYFKKYNNFDFYENLIQFYLFNIKVINTQNLKDPSFKFFQDYFFAIDFALKNNPTRCAMNKLFLNIKHQLYLRVINTDLGNMAAFHKSRGMSLYKLQLYF